MKLIFGTLLLIPILLGCGRENISVHDTAKYLPSIEKGNEIIASLDSYLKQNGNYPKSLNDLVPDYMAEIPKAGKYGNNFYYGDYRSSVEERGKKFNGPEGFTLSFRLSKASILDLGAKAWTSFKYRTDGEYGSERTDVHFKHGKWVYLTRYRYKVGEGGRTK